ncbi:MAG TPA: hypothetical protein DCL41_05235 [Bdellovibrionales bacterium]|nr:hypothetical protein [Pseudobdellovibrionaceae bacterium]HAG91251.1 hypothetical protein [Bdellovibrionales bacterium]
MKFAVLNTSSSSYLLNVAAGFLFFRDKIDVVFFDFVQVNLYIENTFGMTTKTILGLTALFNSELQEPMCVY